MDGPPPWAAGRLRAALVDPEAETFMRALLEHVEAEMPAKSKAQQRLMGADLARARKGKRTRTGMSASHLRKWARKPKGGYKKRKKN